MLNFLIVDKIIKDALIEDIPSEDISANAVIPGDCISKCDLIAKEEGIIAGLDIFKRVFTILGDVNVSLYNKDGDTVFPGEKIGELTGNTHNILMGERVALNLLGRMSGIATKTNKTVKLLEGSKTKLLDTRKTTPNLRILEKYAVKIGGGENHRCNLSDGVLLKDNHISFAGGVKKAVEMAKKSSSFVRKIEVETESLEMVREALEAGADIIMLDNMDIEDIKTAVEIINGKCLVECSGNITPENIKNYCDSGVDYVSSGALTHSVYPLDLSMKNLTLINKV